MSLEDINGRVTKSFDIGSYYGCNMKGGTNVLPLVVKKKVIVAAVLVSSKEAFPMVGFAL
jgi:hypothetical protein